MNTATAGTLLLLLAVVSSGVAFAPAHAAHGDDPTVEIPEGTGLCRVTMECYSPETLTIQEGTTVTWTNSDTIVHTVSHGVIGDDNEDPLFNSGLFQPDNTFSHTFEETGEYPYYCLIHPRMNGVVIVDEAHAEEEPEMPENGIGEEDNMMMEEDNMMMEEDNMMMDGDAMMMTTQGGEIMVSVTSGDPTNDQPLDLQLKFTDAQGNAVEHVNYDVLVRQGNSSVYSESGIHAHMSDSLKMISTRSLESSEPVDVRVTFQGIGLPSTPVADRNGPVGEMIEFEDVPEFGTIAVMILIASIISIVAVTARSNVFARV